MALPETVQEPTESSGGAESPPPEASGLADAVDVSLEVSGSFGVPIEVTLGDGASAVARDSGGGADVPIVVDSVEVAADVAPVEAQPALREVPVQEGAAPRRGFGVLTLALAAAAVVVLGLVWTVVTFAPRPDQEPRAEAPAPSASFASATPEATPSQLEAVSPADSVFIEAQPVASGSVDDVDLEGHDPAEPGATPEDSAALQVEDPEAAPSAGGNEPSEGTVSVNIRIYPSDSRIMEGLEVVAIGRMVVEVQRGRRRVFEIQRDGFSARRLVVDGSETDIRVGLVRTGGGSGDGALVSDTSAAPATTPTRAPASGPGDPEAP
jgi:hypothetical protein